MHRSNGRIRSLLWGTLLALTLSGLAGYSQAQPLSTTVLVPLGGTKDLQMTTKKPIAKAEAKRDGVISIRPIQGNPTTVRLLGQAAESTDLILTDADGKVETYLVIVQRDVENLKAQLRRAIPASAIVVTPMNESTVLLTGTIARAADAPVLDQVVRALGFIPINQVSVGGVQQVQLDVVVAIVSRSAIRSFAFDFLTNSRNFYFASVGSGAAATPTTAGTGGGIGAAVGGLLDGVGSPNGAGTNLLFGVLHNGWNFLGFLQALREDDLLKIVAEPHLVTMSGTPASFISGGEQAIPVPAGLGQVGVQFEEFGTRLNFLPIVLGDGRIHLEVEPEFSTLDPANGVNIQGTTVPGRDTHRVHTTVNVEDGHTIVIGGLIQHEVIGTLVKVPVLGDLPYLGVAFSRKSYEEIEEEVLIVVTPHVVEGVDCAHAPKILPGQETRSPDDYELFLEGILEAPRGQRCVFQNNHYVPAYKNGPSAGVFPCGDGCPGCGGNGCRSGCGAQGCGTVGGCANGSCASGEAPRPMPAVMPPPAPQTQVPPQTLPQTPATLPPVSATPTPATLPTTAQLPPAPAETPVPPASDTAAATGTMPVVPTPVPAEPLRPVPPPEPTSRPTTPTTLPSVVPTPNGGQLP